MRVPGFCGGSYKGDSIIADAQRSVNLYPTPSMEKNQLVLVGTPGRTLWLALADAPLREFHKVRRRVFAAAGGTLYEIFSDQTSTSRGSINRTGNITISNNGSELFITAGSRAYLYDLATNTITQPDADGDLDGVFWEGYFVGLEPASQKLWWSDLYDGSSWNGLDFTSAEGAPDLALRILTDHRELVVFGEESTEFFSHVFDPDNPLYPNRGAHIEYGIEAVRSAIKLDNCLYWIGGNTNGHALGIKTEGYRAQIITPIPISSAWESYSTISDAQSYGYVENGHSFWIIHFPTANRTWAYDASTGLWHERGFWDTVHAQWQVEPVCCHIYAFGKHLVGDRDTGNIYEQKLSIYDDNGYYIRRMRTVPHLQAENKRLYFSSFELHAEMGMGLITGQGSDPQLMLRCSDDGGKTYGNELWQPLGKIGEYSNRAKWTRLGSGRDRVFEVSCNEPTKQTWVDAYVND